MLVSYTSKQLHSAGAYVNSWDPWKKKKNNSVYSIYTRQKEY